MHQAKFSTKESEGKSSENKQKSPAVARIADRAYFYGDPRPMILIFFES